MDNTLSNRIDDAEDAIEAEESRAKTAESQLSASVGDTNFATTNYVYNDNDLSSAVRTLDTNLARIEDKLNSRVDRLEDKVNKHHREMKRGFANLAAMTRLVPNSRSCGDTQIAAGVGYYRGTTGVAAGVFHYINDNILLNAAVGYAGHNSTAVGAGITFGF